MRTDGAETAALAGPPALDRSTVGLMFIGGFVATNAFDLRGQVVSPALGCATLTPHGLALSLPRSLGAPGADFAGYFVHFHLVGLIGYPVGWLFIVAPIRRALMGPGHWLAPSALNGFRLRLFAIGGVTAVASQPFFLGFTGIAWVALVGHVLYGVMLVASLRAIDRD